MADRDFKGVWIPREVWLDERLSMLDKGILAEVDSLDTTEDGCFASNDYLAEFCQCSPTKISKSISKLIELGYLRVKSFDGRKRFLKSSLAKSASQPCRNDDAAMHIMQDSNIPNNTANNTDKSISSKDDDLDGFDTFYSAYPKKKAKQEAIKAWKALKPNPDLIKTILDDLERRRIGEWNGKDEQYIPYPATYLRGKRWEDEATPAQAPRSYDAPDDESIFW